MAVTGAPTASVSSREMVGVPGHGPFMVFWLLSEAPTSAQAERSRVRGMFQGRFPRAGRHDGLGRISLLACGPLRKALSRRGCSAFQNECQALASSECAVAAAQAKYKHGLR